MKAVGILRDIKKISIITGHYGSGKTNVSVNLALYLKGQGKKVVVVDLDIVNPYFRTADFKALLNEKGIDVITPTYANTNLDIPALPASISAILEQDEAYVVVDVGGDDAGAIALGRYQKILDKKDYDMYYVINAYRYMTKNSAEALELLNEIEGASRLKGTKLINNSNLGKQTTLEDVEKSYPFAEEVSKLSNLPIAFTCIKKDIEEKEDKFFPCEIFVKSVWDE